MFQLAMRVESMFEMIMRDDIDTDVEVLKMIDQIGENYGSVISYIFGFDKRFSTEVHVHRALQMPTVSIPSVSFPEFSFPEFKLPEIKFPELTVPDLSNFF